MANEELVTILRQGYKLWNFWMMEYWDAEQQPPDLTGADLRRANLNHANLYCADLTGADLRHAHLIGANLDLAALKGANLSGANLNSATMYETGLDRADLTKAQLKFARLNGTTLDDANLSNAEFGDTVLANVDLSKVKGLETIKHSRPSSIGIDTIYRSNGQIPEIFLRGCGVPDVFIEYMGALTSKPFEFYSCFISYSHQDEAFAQRLHDTLQGKGVRCWLDEEDAKLGVPLGYNIDQGIRMTDKFLLCCSKASLNSGWVNHEIDLALYREAQLQGGQNDVWRIIPLDLDGYLFSDEYDGRASHIKNRLAGDFTNWKADSDKFDQQVAKVIKAIRIQDGQ